MVESKCKNYQLVGMDYSNQRVKRQVAATSKKEAIAAVKRARIIRTVLSIKEKKDES